MKVLLIFILLFNFCRAWDSDEYEIFDLVEEVNQNFYEYLELSQDATTNEIRKAYRRLSLILHPDKNDAPDASLKFRWLASIYDILKDVEKRKIYDKVLVEGLPDWRSPVFYMRRMRKIGLAEGLAYLFVIITIFQYCIYWAHYWEKKFTLKEVLNEKMKKKAKKGQIQDILDEQEDEILGPKPTIYDTLPFQTLRFGRFLAQNLPYLPWTLLAFYKDFKAAKAEEKRLKLEEEQEIQRKEDEKRERKERKKERKKIQVYDEKVGGSNTSESEMETKKKEDIFKQPKNANQMWTDLDLAKLAKLIKKFPPGTPERWERIADLMERLPWEVTKMAKKIKDNCYMVPVSQQAQGITGFEDQKLVSDDRMENFDSEESESEESESDSDYDGGYTVASKPQEFVIAEVKTKVKTKGTKSEVENEENSQNQWSQSQQKALESALVQFPKGTTERWERIANKVPGKTKDECIQRFKTLAEMVKKKKETTAAE